MILLITLFSIAFFQIGIGYGKIFSCHAEAGNVLQLIGQDIYKANNTAQAHKKKCASGL